jgi:uncharacterized repeat protein (TIGR03803 family)
MQDKRFVTQSAIVLTTFALALAVLINPAPALAQTETVLHSFDYNYHDGFHPVGTLVLDSAGNLYGTAGYGGENAGCYTDGQGCGSVFELMPSAGGGWTEKPLHNFAGGNDGAYPWAGVIFDAAGNLYGTTPYGGRNNKGTVFELSPAAGGGWREKILHNFGSGADGYDPVGALVFDNAGNLYGTTSYGGAYGVGGGNSGTVFELSPTSGGWREKILHSFGHGHDGFAPSSNLIFDAAGNLYGTTYYGGLSSSECNPDVHVSCGTVFELSPTSDGPWTEKILHSFGDAGVDGNFPYGGLVFDSAGNLYGTTTGGGDSTICPQAVGCGIVFELLPASGGSWMETILHNFAGDTTDGASPDASLIFDSSGNLYGTASAYGPYGDGTVFEFTPSGSVWTETILHGFGHGSDGKYPNAGVVFDSAGNLYGSTIEGGDYGDGIVFKLTP